MDLWPESVGLFLCSYMGTASVQPHCFPFKMEGMKGGAEVRQHSLPQKWASPAIHQSFTPHPKQWLQSSEVGACSPSFWLLSCVGKNYCKVQISKERAGLEAWLRIRCTNLWVFLFWHSIVVSPSGHLRWYSTAYDCLLHLHVYTWGWHQEYQK